MSHPASEQDKASPVLPLGLYVHVPFCASTCDFCAFYQTKPTAGAVDGFLAGIADEAKLIHWPRPVSTVFWGGGTPGLLAPRDLTRLAEIVLAHCGGTPAEWTVELAPASVTPQRLAALREAGVTRVSMGVQSFQPALLDGLGRQHTLQQIYRAYDHVRAAGFASVNLDLMFALPGQTASECEEDVRSALAFGTEHLSLYQLTLEPNTVFAKYPPALPDDDAAAQMQDLVEALAGQAGLERYEVSAYARRGARARHNVNYWEFGDYLGIGPGAHGKLSFPDRVERDARVRNPESWMQAAVQRDGSHITDARVLAPSDMPFEFMLNALRLRQGVPSSLYTERTGEPLATLTRALRRAHDRGLFSADPTRLQASEQGWRFLNELQALFL